MSNVRMTHKDSIVDEIRQVQQRIAQRAYDLFRRRDAASADEWTDWFTAEQEIVRRPAVELREKDNTYTVSASLAGVEPQDIHVDITPQDVVIKAEAEHTHTPQEGHVLQCEFHAGRVFRSVHFPHSIDVAKARAEYRNGLLTVTAPMALNTQAQPPETRVA